MNINDSRSSLIEDPHVALAVINAAKDLFDTAMQGMSTELLQAILLVPSYDLYPVIDEELERRRNAAA